LRTEVAEIANVVAVPKDGVLRGVAADGLIANPGDAGDPAVVANRDCGAGGVTAEERKLV